MGSMVENYADYYTALLRETADKGGGGANQSHQPALLGSLTMGAQAFALARSFEAF